MRFFILTPVQMESIVIFLNKKLLREAELIFGWFDLSCASLDVEPLKDCHGRTMKTTSVMVRHYAVHTVSYEQFPQNRL